MLAGKILKIISSNNKLTHKCCPITLTVTFLLNNNLTLFTPASEIRTIPENFRTQIQVGR